MFLVLLGCAADKMLLWDSAMMSQRLMVLLMGLGAPGALKKPYTQSF